MLRFIAALLAPIAATAVASPVNVKYLGTGTHGGTVRAVFNDASLASQAGWSSASLWAGALKFDINGSIFQTYCTELTQYVPSRNQPTVYDQRSIASATVPGPALGTAKANAIDTLFFHGYNLVTSGAKAAAFQALVWEIAYEYDGSLNSLNTASGRLSFTSGVNQNHFSFFKNLIASPARQGYAYAITNPDAQDQIVYDPRVAVSIPLPPAALAALPIAGFFAARRLARRK